MAALVLYLAREDSELLLDLFDPFGAAGEADDRCSESLLVGVADGGDVGAGVAGGLSQKLESLVQRR